MNKEDRETWRQLKEAAQHGNLIFPLATYQMSGRKYSFRVNIHWHKEVEFMRLISGEFRFGSSKGEMVLKGPAIVFIPANKLHTLYLPPLCKEESLVFDPKLLEMQNYDEILAEIVPPLISGDSEIVILTPQDEVFLSLDKLLDQIFRLKEQDSAVNYLLIKAKLLELAALFYNFKILSLTNELSKNRGRPEKLKHDKLKEILTYIKDHYTEPIDLDKMAKLAGLQKNYFCRVFKNITAMNLTDYVNEYRLKKTMEDLVLTDESIALISKRHGFENQSHFYHLFKVRFGITPFHYRQLRKEDLKNKATQKA